MNVAPITFAKRIAKVFGIQRFEKFLLAVYPTFAQKAAGSNAIAVVNSDRMRDGPRTICHTPHASANKVDNARPTNKRVSGKKWG
jgi:hypothetical protein